MALPPTTTPLVGTPVHWRPRGGFSSAPLFVGRERDAPLVIPKICDVCTQQRLEKPASLYWAWVGPNGHRVAYKQLVCADCFMEQYAQDILRADEPALLCPSCGMSVVDGYEAVYLTYCLPGMPKAQAELPYCPIDAARVRSVALTNARPLEDRGVGVGGPQPAVPNPNDIWAKLGISHREDAP